MTKDLAALIEERDCLIQEVIKSTDPAKNGFGALFSPESEKLFVRLDEILEEIRDKSLAGVTITFNDGITETYDVDKHMFVEVDHENEDYLD